MNELKLKELTVVAQPVPDDKKAYFDHVGTPQEKPKCIQFGGPDRRLETSILLECPVCHKESRHEGNYGWAEMWTWGLGGRGQLGLDEILSNVSRHLSSNQSLYRCPHCGSSTTLDDASIKKFCKIVREGVGNLPEQGADWALQAHQGFMVMHNWGLRDFQYHVIRKNYSGDIIIFGWLLDKCGCEHCQRRVEAEKEWVKKYRRGY